MAELTPSGRGPSPRHEPHRRGPQSCRAVRPRPAAICGRSRWPRPSAIRPSSAPASIWPIACWCSSTTGSSCWPTSTATSRPPALCSLGPVPGRHPDPQPLRALGARWAPDLLSAQVPSAYGAQVDLAIANLAFGGDRWDPRNVVHIRRELALDDRLVERMTLTGYLGAPAEYWVDLALGCDFADIFEVRGWRREARGQYFAPEPLGRCAGVRLPRPGRPADPDGDAVRPAGPTASPSGARDGTFDSRSTAGRARMGRVRGGGRPTRRPRPAAWTTAAARSTTSTAGGTRGTASGRRTSTTSTRCSTAPPTISGPSTSRWTAKTVISAGIPWYSTSSAAIR